MLTSTAQVMETLINESLENLQLNTPQTPFTYRKKEEEKDESVSAQLIKACQLGQLSNVQWILTHLPNPLAPTPTTGKTAWDVVQGLPDTNPIKRAIVKYKQDEKV